MTNADLTLSLPSKPAWRGRRKVRRDMIVIAHDLLGVWDTVAIFSSGYVSAVGYSLFIPHRSMMEHFFGHGGRLLLIGALLAPFVLREPSRDAVNQLSAAAAPAYRVVPRLLALLAILLTTAYVTKIEHEVPRLWICLWGLLITTSVIAGRILLSRNIRKLEEAGVLRNRIAIVGSALSAEALRREIVSVSNRAIDIIGVFDDRMSGGGATLRDLIELGTHEPLDLVLVAPSIDRTQDSAARIATVLHELKALDVQIAYCPDLSGLELYRCSFDRLGERPLVVVSQRAIRHWGLVLKEIEDKTVSLLLLAMLLPLLGLIAFLIRLDSRGPALFRQRRHGWNNREFEILKFRTMTWDPSTSAGQLRQTQRYDRRVTRIGSFLRHSSLDELPQLMNVLRGDMSLVGPRPHPVAMRTDEQSCDEIVAEYAHRHRVKPGITGWAQINGCRGATENAEQVRRRIALDIEYIERWSILFDLKILLLTPFKIIFDRTNAF